MWAYANLLVRYRRAVFFLPLLFGAIAAIVARGKIRQHTARARFVLEDVSSDNSMAGQLAAQFGISVGRASSKSSDFYIALLRSRAILKEVVLTTYTLGPPKPFKGTLIKYFNLGFVNDKTISAGTGRVEAMIVTKIDAKTSILTLEVTTPHPELSVNIVNRLLDLINGYNLQRRQAQARIEFAFVEEQLAQADSLLRQAEESLFRFGERNRVIASSPALIAEEGRLQRKVNLRQQLYLMLAQGREASRMEVARRAPVITIIDRPEGFVEPAPRGTVRQVLLGLIAGLLLAISYAMVADSIRRRRRAGSPDYDQFLASVQDAFRNLRLGVSTRRAGGPS